MHAKENRRGVVTTRRLREGAENRCPVSSAPCPPKQHQPITALDIFQLRAECRAILVEACAMDMQDAVDGLQAAAAASGLVNEIGQNRVQAIMATAFREVMS